MNRDGSQPDPNSQQQCNMMNSLNNGYRSECVQKYGERRLIAVDPDTNETIVRSFPFPSCCQCFITQD